MRGRMVARPLSVAVGGDPLHVPAVLGECVVGEGDVDVAVAEEAVLVKEEGFRGVRD